MKKLFLIPACLALLATSCGDDPTPSSGPLSSWDAATTAEMVEHFGETLPVCPFEASTFEHGWVTEGDYYFLGDVNTEDVVSAYVSKLTKSHGWTEGVDQEGYKYVTKSVDLGDLYLYAEWYEDETDPDTGEKIPAGNEIQVYVDDGGVTPGPGGDDPVTGTYEFVMGEMGWTDQEECPSVVADPGLTIVTDPGENDKTTGIPKYYDNGAAIRLYALNTITFAADEITKIEFTYTNTDSQTMTPDVGALTNKVWEGKASEVTFTLGSKGQIRITSLKVTGTFSGGGTIPGGDVDEVVEEIAYAIYAALPSDVDYFEEEDGAFYIGVDLGATSLQTACSMGVQYLPSGLEVYEEMAEGTWDDGDSGYFVTYVDTESMVFIQIGSYQDGSYYITQFTIY